MSDSKSLEIERLQKQMAALKEKYESKLKAKDSQIQKLKEKVASQEVELEVKQRFMMVMALALGEIAKQERGMVLEAFKFVTDIDEPLARTMVKNINRIAARMAKFAREVNRSRVERKTGGEKIGGAVQQNGTVVQETQANSSIELENDTVDQTEAKPPRAAVALTHLIRQQEELEAEENLSDEFLSVLQANRPPKDYVEPPETHRGRRNNINELERFDETEMKPVVECPKCHTPLDAIDPKTGERKIADLGVLVDMIKTIQTNLSSKQAGAVKLNYHAYRCSVCGTIFNDRPEGGDSPIAPGRTISTKSSCTIQYGQVLGFPINAVGKDFERDAKLGSNTVALTAHTIDHFILTPVAKLLEEALKKQSAVCVDETPFSVKHAQHAGRRPKVDPSPSELYGSTYVMAATSARRSEEQIQLFTLLYGRSSDLMNKKLMDFQFKSLSCDDYAGYNEVMRNHPGAVRQLCLIHWRRTLKDNAFDLKIMDDYFKVPPRNQKAFLLEAFKTKKPLYLVGLVFRAISYIYGYERWIDKIGPQSEKLAEIRKKQTALMDLVSTLVKKLAVGHAELQETKDGQQRWRRINKDDPLGLTCAQFLNNEPELRTFLTAGNYLIEPDNNTAERCIRPVAVIRSNSHFWHSREYAEGTLARLTVIKTLELNHIEPLPWMQKLCGEVFDFISRRLIDYKWQDAGVLTAQVGLRAEAKPGEEDTLDLSQVKYRLSELMKEFPFEKYAKSILERGRLYRKLHPDESY